MSYEAFILGVMLTLTPEHYRPGPSSPRLVTYKAIAADINAAVTSPLGRLPFDGPAAKEATAIALAGIGYNESGYRDDVRSCKLKGDHGRSISVFQLMAGPGRKTYTEKQICSDGALAARLGLDILTWYDHSGSTISMFQGYAAGNPNAHSYAANTQYRYFSNLAALNNIKVKSTTDPDGKPGRPYADYITPPSVVTLSEDEKVRTLAVSTGQ